jgi:hypothetical protein
MAERKGRYQTTMQEALRRHDEISKILKRMEESRQNTPTPQIVKDLEDAGIILELYTEPIGYPEDRNMI